MLRALLACLLALPLAALSQPADDGQWTMPAKDYASTRFSVAMWFVGWVLSPCAR